MTDERRDERIDRIVSEAVRAEYGEADPPREAMWEGIAAERSAGRGANPAERSAGRGAGFRWAAALATAAVLAAVVFGVARRGGEEPPEAGPAAPVVDAPSVDPLDLVLRGHLARAGALLDTVGSGEAVAPAEAAPLLATTRILLDDPALDPPTARLLADAEVALALVVRSGADAGSPERAALRETVVDGRLATRLRSASGGTR